MKDTHATHIALGHTQGSLEEAQRNLAVALSREKNTDIRKAIKEVIDDIGLTLIKVEGLSDRNHRLMMEEPQ